jgi:putative endonuclease
MAEHNEKGKSGELAAKRFLEEKGYEILECNWRHKQYEIDIIAKSEGIIIAVEVKTRSGIDFGTPESFVNKQKQSALIKGINQYVEVNNLDNEIRFDIISIVMKGEKISIYHIEDAFYPSLK